MPLEQVSASKCFGGTQHVFAHPAETTGCTMRFSAYVPPQAEDGPCPVLYYLSGLTCTEENFTVKAAAQRHATEHGVVVIAPDTSPRGPGVADDEAWDLGTGAGFYVNATQAPWAANYRMYDYVVEELPEVVAASLPVDPASQSVMGHSMGGHGALVIALRNPDTYRSVSVLAPICHPVGTDLGKRAFTAYLGEDEAGWRDYDALELVRAGKRTRPILIDQGDADDFYKAGAMMVEDFRDACREGGQEVTLRLQPGYDHAYFFVQTFMPDHLAWHAGALKG